MYAIRSYYDCANGSAYKTTPWLLRELGADVAAINDTPNGTNINEGCGSLHMEEVIRKVRETKADMGIAHDGDADRVLIVITSYSIHYTKLYE